MSVKMTKDNFPAFERQLQQLIKNQVLVGIPAENADRQPEEGEEKIPLNNAEIGYLMETGRPEQNLPERPFLVPGVESVEEKIVAQLKAGAKRTLDGETDAVEKTFHRVGLTAQAAVRNKIREGPFEPLADSTIKNRRRRGRTGEKPLIDTGQLLRSVSYVIRSNRKREG